MYCWRGRRRPSKSQPNIKESVPFSTTKQTTKQVPIMRSLFHLGEELQRSARPNAFCHCVAHFQITSTPSMSSRGISESLGFICPSSWRRPTPLRSPQARFTINPVHACQKNIRYVVPLHFLRDSDGPCDYELFLCSSFIPTKHSCPLSRTVSHELQDDPGGRSTHQNTHADASPK